MREAGLRREAGDAGDRVAAATGERRQQLKWLASGGAVTLIVLAVSFGINPAGTAGEVLGIGLAALPVGTGVGILKYRLYDIDRIISRAVSYAIVTGLLVGLYAGLVLLATQVMTVKSPVQDDLTGVVQRTLEPAHLSVWVSRSR